MSKTLSKQEATAWVRGYDARRLGTPIEACPYTEPGDAWAEREWQLGWQTADQQIRSHDGKS